MAERRSKKVKPICLFPCSGFNIPGEAVRMASGIISEEIYPDISETMGIVELTRAAREFIRRFLQIEPDREIIFRLADREEVANKITHTKEEDIKEAVRLIKACIDEFNPPAGANP